LRSSPKVKCRKIVRPLCLAAGTASSGVGLDRLRAQRELLGDVLTGVAVRDQAEDLLLARAQADQPRPRRDQARRLVE
jgi:hypothetical protein